MLGRMENSMKKLTRLYRPSSSNIATKPAGFPLASVTAIRSFEQVDDEDYCDVGTRIVQAFEEALKRNRKFPKINQVEFVHAMKRGLHCAKERVRKLHAAARRRNENEDSENDEDEAMF
ncbi:hypothetical protein PV328_006065 [Microctonus aethiopoides]|uniref:Uncharacterized protein n=1 Tax=Microctonus aethiopoides TaxID=144406 RepID=A0AA39FNP8_9HYME|nr:hypothetical protein PV328_006065 [Microctonus aethiopoides]